jgi:hypothetical protein
VKPVEPVELLGVVLAWPAPRVTPGGARIGGGLGRVRLDADGRVVEAAWSGQATVNRDRRATAAGQRVRLVRDARGTYRATLLERVVDPATGNATPPPPRPPPVPLPALLARAVAAALACGESPWTIAARHGVSVERVLAR